MSWNIPALDTVEITDRKGPPKVPESFQLMPVDPREAPPVAPVSMTGVVSFYDFTDRRAIEALDTHAEEVISLALELLIIRRFNTCRQQIRP